MILPEVGRGSEKAIEETTKAYEKVADRIAELKPDTLVISSPHTIMYADYHHISPGREAEGDFSNFGAGQVRMQVAYDERFVDELCVEAMQSDLDAGTMGERDKSLDHGTMVPLYFILQKYTDFRLVRIGLSGLPLEHQYRVGMAIQKVAKKLGKRTVYIASGDLSHKLKEEGPYGFDPAGPEYDDRIMDVMGRGAFDELFEFDEHFLEKCAECGHRSFVMMAGAFDRQKVSIEKLSHQDVTGVGYGICCYERISDEPDEDRAFLDLWEQKETKRRALSRSKEDLYVRLARKSLESHIRYGQTISAKEALEELVQVMQTEGQPSETDQNNNRESEPAEQEKALLNRKAGAFVSLHKQGQLRGCIGTIAPVRASLAEEIIENAISAAVHDNRFLPVTEDELELLEYSVDVLSETEPIDSQDQLDVKRYGVIVTKGYKRGLLLPNLDGVDTVAEQLSIAKRKAGLSPNEKGCSLERFEVVRHY
jgi:AmmeMemoRadiSam system protein A